MTKSRSKDKGRPWGMRRRLLASLTVGGVLAALPRAVWARVVKAFPTRTVDERNYRFDPDTGLVIYADGREEPYALTVDGLVEHPLSLDYAGLLALPQKRQISDFHCVEGWSVNDVHWSGVAFNTLVDMAAPLETAKYAVFHSLGTTRSSPGGLDHYVESFSLEDLLDPDLEFLLALAKDDAPLSMERGAPARVVCPFSLAYKSIKFVARMEFTDAPVDGWWTRANSVYPWKAPVPDRRLRRKPGES